MKSSLEQVQRAVVGEIVLTDELEAIASEIFNNQVPKAWAGVGFLSLKPLASWIIDCNDRIDFLENWLSTGTPIKYWFSGFFFPQAFLTGTLQNYARRNNVPIDRVNFDYNMLDKITHEDIKEAPADGCMIYGLFLEGCKWDYDNSALAESDPKKLFVDLPLMHLTPIVDRKKPEDGIYMTPMYRVLSRTGTLSTTGHSTNFVIMLELSSKEDQDKWILAGVACMCSLRY